MAIRAGELLMIHPWIAGYMVKNLVKRLDFRLNKQGKNQLLQRCLRVTKQANLRALIFATYTKSSARMMVSIYVFTKHGDVKETCPHGNSCKRPCSGMNR